MQDIKEAIAYFTGIMDGSVERDEVKAAKMIVAVGGSVLTDLNRIATALEAIAGYGPLSDHPGSDLGALAERLAKVEDQIAGGGDI